MNLAYDNYYHLFNRSINEEKIFYKEDNYLYFLKKYHKLTKYIDTLAYCLMPTHFHFLVKIINEDTNKLKRAIGDLLSGYTKAINRQLNRHGSLFQQHTKANIIKDQKQLVASVHYIHQNPSRAELVKKLEDWVFSSYPEYIGLRKGKLPKTEMILSMYKDTNEFIEHSNLRIDWDY